MLLIEGFRLIEDMLSCHFGVAVLHIATTQYLLAFR
jgi:hypothetical protein